jgi:hypothetical protein
VIGCRLPLDTGLIGQVARTGKSASFRASSNNQTLAKPVFPESLTAMALPIFYADHLHGVLYVETVELIEISEEDSLLLHTLADLISGALHNALTFQKAQEQAITDGLTNVKTHRFFMEALSSEWKRSSRAGRSFALVLMDLDRFKFVNDFYGHLENDLSCSASARSSRPTAVARTSSPVMVVTNCDSHAGNVDGAGSSTGLQAGGWVSADSCAKISAPAWYRRYPLHGSSPRSSFKSPTPDTFPSIRAVTPSPPPIMGPERNSPLEAMSKLTSARFKTSLPPSRSI